MATNEWDEIETSLLIEAYIDIKEHNAEKEMRLLKLSNDLRVLARNRGIKIDDTYRNYNGMQWQIGYINNAFNNHESTRKPSKIFCSMVNLYKNNKKEFSDILLKAHSELNKGEIITTNLKSQFINWLSKDKVKNITKNELADILEDAFITYKDKNLWSIKDAKQYSILRNEICEEKRFKHTDKRSYKIFVSYSKYYKTFLEYNNISSFDNENIDEIQRFTLSMEEADFYSFVKEYLTKRDNQNIVKKSQEYIEILRELNGMLSIDGEVINLFQLDNVSDFEKVEAQINDLDLIEDSKLLSDALQVYRLFIKSNNVSKDISRNDTNQTINNDYKVVLESFFKEGYAFRNPLRKRKFISEYENLNRTKFSDGDEVYISKLHTVGFESDNMIYIPSIIDEKTTSEIEEYINTKIEHEPYVVYYSAIFDQFENKLNSLFGPNMLKKFVEFVFKDGYEFGFDYISKKDVMVDLKQTIIDIFRNVHTPLERNDLYEKLPGISHEAIDAIINDRDFLVNYRGKSYFYKDIFEINDEQLCAISNYIDEMIYKNEQVSGDEIYDYIEKNMPELLEINDKYTRLGIKNILKEKLTQKYNFTGDVISKLGDSLDVRDLFREFCKQRESFSFDELKEFRNSIHKTYIDYNTVFEYSVRMNHDAFIRNDMINFDVDQIDRAISKFCVNGYTSFVDISSYSEFPPIQYGWNEYLLESFVNNYSNQYLLMHSSFNEEKPVGAIVKNDGQYNNFNELIIQIIKDNELYSREKALTFLIENQYMLTRKFKDLDILIEKAKKGVA